MPSGALRALQESSVFLYLPLGEFVDFFSDSELILADKEGKTKRSEERLLDRKIRGMTVGALEGEEGIDKNEMWWLQGER